MMTFKRWKISLIDIALLALVIAVVATLFPLSRAKASAELERTKFEARLRNTEQKLSTADKQASLTSLQQRLQNVQATPVPSNPVVKESEATNTISDIMQVVEENNLTINKYSTTHTSTSLEAKEYPAIQLSLNVEGRASALVNLLTYLNRVTLVTVVQGISINGVEGQSDAWRMTLEVFVYYDQG